MDSLKRWEQENIHLIGFHTWRWTGPRRRSISFHFYSSNICRAILYGLKASNQMVGGGVHIVKLTEAPSNRGQKTKDVDAHQHTLRSLVLREPCIAIRLAWDKWVGGKNGHPTRAFFSAKREKLKASSLISVSSYCLSQLICYPRQFCDVSVRRERRSEL